LDLIHRGSINADQIFKSPSEATPFGDTWLKYQGNRGVHSVDIRFSEQIFVQKNYWKIYEALVLDFLEDFFLLDVELLAFFELFDEFEAFVADSEPPPEEATGAGEWGCDNAALEELARA
jgi:hypothetical protein